MKTLTLPGAWAQVWKRTREVLHDIGRTADRTEPIEPRIGGGTALAARWKHRASIDIDVLLPGRETLVDLTWDDEMNLAERLGGKMEWAAPGHLKVAVEEGEIDISVLRPQPPGAEETSVVEGRAEKVLSNTQILRGKLERATDLLPRDTVDVIVATKADPAALAEAVSMLDPIQAEGIAQAWKDGNDTLERRLDEEVADLNPGYRIDRTRLGSGAAKALETHRYRQIKVERAGDEVTIRRNTAAGDLDDIKCNANEAAKVLLQTGLGAHLNANGPVTARQLLDAIRSEGGNREQTVYDSDNERSIAQVRGKAPGPPHRPWVRPPKPPGEQRRRGRN